MKRNRIVRIAAAAVLIVAAVTGTVGCNSTANASENALTAAKTVPNKSPIVLVWYPNESAADYQDSRDAFAKIITDATGREVEHKLTTDYAIAIEAIASGSADVAFMGAAGYIEAKKKNPNVDILFVNSGASGTLDDAIYYSWLSVKKGQESNYLDGDKYSIANIQGKRMSFVSNSSTSGFKVPSTNILEFFQATEQWAGLDVDDLVEGGSNAFFEEVLFGGSHQGSAFNLLSKKCDVAAFCDTELVPYSDCTEGTENRAGAVYAIKADASAPFDTVWGEEFVIIQSTPVLNGPFAFNGDKLDADDLKCIRDAFFTEETANNPNIFVVKDSGYVGMFKKTDKECFVLVEDAWYNPIREMN